MMPGLYTPRLAAIWTRQQEAQDRARRQRRHPFRLAYTWLACCVAGAVFFLFLGMALGKHAAPPHPVAVAAK